MKKEVIVLCSIILLLNIAIAQTDNSSATSGNAGGVDKAYQCLKDVVNGKDKNSISLAESIFATLALGSNSKLESGIANEKSTSEECWPKGGCTIKETAQALLAYNRLGKSTKKIESWLLSKAQNARGLTWYLEIDIQNHIESECTLNYDGADKKIKVREDMKLEGNPGACFDIGYGGYWLKFRESCIGKEIQISCNQDFVTTLAYQKGTSGTVFVSSETHSSPGLGTTNEKVESKCFGLNQCDYEGTLWAGIALKKTGADVSAYIPYLLTLSNDNQKYFPSSFLYILTGGEDHYGDIILKQKKGQYWEQIGSQYNRYYDTSLAMLALADSSAVELENAKNYLLSIQTKEGCWNNNNIRDTGFILYSGFSKKVAPSSDGSSTALCEEAGFSCESGFECQSAGGNILYEYDCSNKGGLSLCCSIKVQEASCSQKGGLSCASNQECTGRIESAADGTCCIGGACQNIQVENICEKVAGGNCRTSCFSNEETASDSCSNAGEICCIAKTEEATQGNNWTWVIIFGILILLLILAIIFRKKISMWFYRRKGNTRIQRPLRPMGPSYAARPQPRFTPARASPRRPVSVSAEDKELDETMKKLKEMSK